jgi:hypothetical protein
MELSFLSRVENSPANWLHDPSQVIDSFLLTLLQQTGLGKDG